MLSFSVMSTQIILLLLLVLENGRTAFGRGETCDSFVDCRGVCGGIVMEDCMGVCGGKAVEDCLGICGGVARPDCAGLCEGQTRRDCDNVCGGQAIMDECGTCGGDNQACADCMGVPNGDHEYDMCGVCGGANECLDCNGIPNGPKKPNECGSCEGDTSCLDCNGIPFGPSKKDQCGICDGNDECVDCQGVPWGGAMVDQCEVCGGADECLGCDGQPNSGMVLDACGECGGDGTSCQGCDGVANSGLIEDHCGVCGGDDSSCCGPDGFCSGHGECVADIPGCDCDVGWTGPLCNRRQDLCRGQDCNGGRGECASATGLCTCQEGWTGLSCEYRSCGGPEAGWYHPGKKACICQEGYDGPNCENCGSAPDQMAYVCLERHYPTQSTYLEFMLFAVPQQKLTFYLDGTAPLTASSGRMAILPDSIHQEVHYGCNCRAILNQTTNNDGVSPASLKNRASTINKKPTSSPNELLASLMVRSAESLEVSMAMEMHDCTKDDLQSCEFESGAFAGVFPVLFFIAILIFVCVILILFTFVPVRRFRSTSP